MTFEEANNLRKRKGIRPMSRSQYDKWRQRSSSGSGESVNSIFEIDSSFSSSYSSSSSCSSSSSFSSDSGSSGGGGGGCD